MEKVATENKFSDTLGNIFNIDENGNQINNIPDCAIRQKCYIMFMLYLPTGKRSENVTELAFCSAAGQLLPPTVTFKCVNKTQDLGDDLRPGQMCT